MSRYRSRYRLSVLLIGITGNGYQRAYRYIGIGIIGGIGFGSPKKSVFYQNLPIISYR
jgi:hypothetical protein